jgi:Putative zinc- or iron-chelating domain
MAILDASNAFGFLLTKTSDSRDLVENISRQSYQSFEGNIDCKSLQGSPVACHGGCASCCTICVAVTAPEVLNIARHIRRFPEQVSFGLTRRIMAADDATRRLGQRERMASSLVCPLIENDLCILYSVRPLACRGHASYDEEACRDALGGGASEVPVSALHLTVRSLVQNAMQSALRDGRSCLGELRTQSSSPDRPLR